MFTITLPSVSHDYTTKIILLDKERPEQDFRLAKITCLTPLMEGVLQSIGINDKTLQLFSQDLKRIEHLGKVKMQLRTKFREEFTLRIIKQAERNYLLVDVLLRLKSNFMHLKYEIDPQLLLHPLG